MTKLSALTTSIKSNSSTPAPPIFTDGEVTANANIQSISPTKGISFTVPSTSKRRRVSDEENCGLTRVTLFDAFVDSASSHRDDETRKKTRNQHAIFDSDDEDNEDDDDRHDEDYAKKIAHEKNKQQLLERITRANRQSTSMEGEFDELVMTIPRARLYENKGDGWLDRGICMVKFLRDVEEGEYSFGMIRMRLVMTNLNESVTLKIDDLQANRMGTSNDKPTYAWRALGTHMYSLRFPTVADSFQWKDFYDRSRVINQSIRRGQSGVDAADTTAGDEIANQMLSLSTTSATTS
mmetsp:Transcript_23465/g.67617  ORF Transcript_23465/g.67617 Transcript_23465/m.67617 type:complete len:294 (-) Transcript_23465:2060-2941(-)